MPELAPENQGLYFQPSYDRAFEAQLERDLIAQAKREKESKPKNEN